MGTPDHPSTIKPLRYFRGERRAIIGIGFTSLIAAYTEALALVLLVPLAKAITASEHHYEGSLGPLTISVGTGKLAAMAAGAIVAATIVNIVIAWQRAKAVSHWEYAARERILDSFLQADYPTQAAERLGTLGTMSTYTARGANALGALCLELKSALTITVFMFGALFLDYRGAVLMFVMVAILSVALRPAMKRTKRYHRSQARMQVEYNQELTEATRMARDVRVFAVLEPLGESLTGSSQRMAHVRLRSQFVSGVTTPTYQYLGMLFIVGALALAQNVESVDVAAIGVIALLLLRGIAYGQSLQSGRELLIESMPYVEKLEQLDAMYKEHATVDGTVPLEDVHRIDLDELRYSYDGEVDVLKGITATLHRGEILGVVGPSGSGKSTLSQLLLRLRTPTGGRILVNGTPSDQYTLASWAHHVALVPQDPRLLHGTVADNIAFLDKSITHDQVVAAAEAASIHDVIDSLEDGYDTLIGPAFRDLSGGQIQRIGIARALVRGADVLVLDEPTSALDVHSEAVIQETIESLRHKALVIIIAHRLSTLSICDRIMVLRDGDLESLGTLAAVAESSDFFRRAIEVGSLDVSTTEPGRLPNLG